MKKKFALLNSSNIVVELLEVEWEEYQAIEMNAIECTNANIAVGYIFIDNIFYPPKPSMYHYPLNGEWVLDNEELLKNKKNNLLKIVEDIYDNQIKNGAFAINITPASKEFEHNWILPQNENFDIFENFYKENNKHLYLFVRYSNENRDQSFVANSIFSSNKELVLPISFTLDGIVCYDKKSENNEIIIDSSYLKLKAVNKILLDIIFNTIVIKKENDANYKDYLINKIRTVKNIEELENLKIEYRDIDADDKNKKILGFNKTILLDTLHQPLYNNTDMKLYYLNGNEKIYI